MRQTALSLAIAVSAGLGLAAPALAQTTTTAPGTTPPAATPTVPPAATGAAPAEVPAPGKPAVTHGKAHHGGSQGMNAYLTRLHDQLKITAGQEPLWGPFADAMRDGAAATGQGYRQRREELAHLDALKNMDSFIALEQARITSMQKSATAFRALYETMPQEQQQLADQVFRDDLPGSPHRRPSNGQKNGGAPKN